MDMESQELDDRMDRCRTLAISISDAAGNEERRYLTERLEHLIEKQSSLKATFEQTMVDMEEDLRRVRAAREKITGESHGYDLERLSNLTKDLETAQCDMLVSVVLGRDGSLNRLRSIGGGRLRNLLSVENEMLSREVDKLKDERDDLEDKVKSLSLDRHKLRQRGNKYKRKFEITRMKLSIKSAYAKTLHRNLRKVRISMNRQQKDHLEKSIAAVRKQTESWENDRIVRSQISIRRPETLPEDMEDDEEYEGVVSPLADLVGALVSRPGADIHHKLRSWMWFASEVEDGLRLDVGDPSSTWTLLSPWGNFEVNDTFDNELDTSNSLIGMLARLYLTQMDAQHPLRLLRSIALALGKVERIPLDLVLDVFGRLFEDVDPTSIASGATNLPLSIASLALLQAIRSMNGRLADEHIVRLANLEARIARLVDCGGMGMIGLAELLADGDGLTDALIASQEDHQREDHNPYYSQAVYFPTPGVGLARLSGWRAIVLFSTADRTVRLVKRGLGGWDAFPFKYRIRSKDDDPDVILENVTMRDGLWLQFNLG
ncbi:hypothetical protein F4806DRAFT_504886 [Annulohypoxylon nitens]|nr:hypothetical protein F4806DRAFT_504886 [Annulohypoxylon nitens]